MSAGTAFVFCHLSSDVDPQELYKSIIAMLNSVVPGYSFSVSLGFCRVEPGARDIATEREADCEITLHRGEPGARRIHGRVRRLAHKIDSCLLFASVENVTKPARAGGDEERGLYDVNGAPVHDVIAISDVTAEYGGRADEDMPPCERTVTDEQRQSIMELSMRTHPGIWSVSFSPDGKADSLNWSKEICRLIGCSLEDRAQLLFDTLSSHVHPDDRTEVHRVFELLHGTDTPLP